MIIRNIMMIKDVYKIFLLVLFCVGIFFVNAVVVKAADCGDGVGACGCGSTVVANYTLPDDLDCSEGSVGLVIGANNITIDGGNHTILGDIAGTDSGISNSGGYDNVSIKNLNIQYYYYGIYFLNSVGTSNQAIDNVTVTNCWRGIYLESSSYNNIINSTINSNTDSLSLYGIYIENSSHNTFTDNTIAYNDYGVYLTSSSSNTFTSNDINFNLVYGISFDSSTSNVFTSNNINSNVGSYAIYISSTSSNSNTFENNIIYNNRNTIYNTSSTVNTYSGNQIYHNKNNKTFTFTEPAKIYDVGDTISLNVSAFNPNGTNCVGCTVVNVYPSETIIPDNTWASTNNPQGHFIATKSGTYSVVFTITDSNSNITKRILKFLVGDNQEVTTKYYYNRGIPTHGQPAGNGNDSQSLYLTTPTSTEEWQCGLWVQNSPDELPNFPVSNLTDINIYTWYKQSMVTGGYVGIERYLKYTQAIDYSSSVSAATDYTWSGLKSFDLSALGGDWMMDYTNNWYWLSLKLSGTQPYQTTFPSGHTADESSYADFTYSYTTTPAVKSISNDDVNVLSATAPTTDTDDATIVLDYPLSGTASANIVLGDPDNSHPFRRPFQGYTTTINSNGTVTLAATGLTSTATSIGSVPMDITPNAGTIAVSITTWDTYSKEWTETGTGAATASHTIGGLEANTYQTLSVGGVEYDTYLADENGDITFNYTGGYSAHTFTLEQVDTAPPTNIVISDISVSSSSQLVVTAETAIDVQSGLAAAPYWFVEATGNSGGSSSTDWQASNVFVDTDLLPSTMYTYKVKVKDAVGNISEYSGEVSQTTGVVAGSNSYIVVQLQSTGQQTQIQQKPEPEKQLTKEETISQLKQQLIQLLTQVIQMLMQQIAEMEK